MEDGVQSPPLMRLPSEVRVMIYNLLVEDNGHKTFPIRSGPAAIHKPHIQRRRTTYRVLRRGLLLESQSTYYLRSKVMLHASILYVNRKIYEEASQILYGTHCFDFGDHIEAIVPFLSDLRAPTRSLVREITLTKRGSVYLRDFDHCEWRNACDFIS